MQNFRLEGHDFKKDVKKVCIDNVLKHWKICRALYNSFPGDTEADRREYISEVLKSLPVFDTMKYLNDDYVTDSPIKGKVDCTIAAKNGVYCRHC